MKREQVEHNSPGPRRKARLERQATYMMSLPREIRTMIMMKLEPYQQFILYSEVEDMDFKRWCDEEFWAYALHREFRRRVKMETPHMVENPRWLYFTYVVHRHMFKSHDEVTFQKDLADGTFERVEMYSFGDTRTSLGLTTTTNMLQFVLQLVNARLKHSLRVPLMTIETIDDGGLEYHITLGDANRLCFELIYMFFSKGFSWYKMVEYPDYGEEYLINCHICGKAATGYDAEDPTKLLCGPACSFSK
jgi:hypothetical protein